MELRLNFKTIFFDFHVKLENQRINNFIGPNGTGKSTALRLIYTTLINKPYSMPVEYGIYGRTSIEYLLPKHLIDSLADDSALEYLNVLDFEEKLLNRKIFTLSSGEAQKLFLAISLARLKQKSVLILDEPFSNIDTKTSEILEELLWDQIINNNKLVIISNHHWSYKRPVNNIDVTSSNKTYLNETVKL